MEKVILLNGDYNFLGLISWKKAVKLMFVGKVEVVKHTNRLIKTTNDKVKIYLPKVVKFIKLVRQVYKNKVPFNKKNVITRDKYVCQYCGDTVKNGMTIDHIIPKSQGGKSNFENCVASCHGCNNTKSNRTPNEASMSLRRQPSTPTIMEFISIKMKLLGVDETLEDLWKT